MVAYCKCKKCPNAKAPLGYAGYHSKCPNKPAGYTNPRHAKNRTAQAKASKRVIARCL